MRLSKTLMSTAALAVMALSACSTPGDVGRSEENRRMIDAEFGAVGPKSNPAAFKVNGQGGMGFSMVRLYSEKPVPNQFSTRVPEQFENTLVVDFGVEMKIEDAFPIYRIGMDPTKISERRINLWPSHVLLEAPAGKLAARLPEVRIPGSDGMIWTDWTYCADCFDLEDIRAADVDDADQAFASLSAAYAAVATKNGVPSPYGGQASFTVTPGVGILVGEAAVDMAGKASDVISASKARIDEMRPARDAYSAMKAEFANTASPSNEVVRLCGEYQPNRDAIDAVLEKARVDAYLDCAVTVIESFDGAARRAEIQNYRIYERDLAAKAGLPAAARMTFPTHSQEILAARAILDAAVDRHNGFAMAVTDRAMPAASVPQSQTKPAIAPLPATRQPSIEELARNAIDTAEVKPAPAIDQEPARKSLYYVARLLNDGANMSIGDQGKNCLGEMACETGSIIALIAATSYCEEPQAVSKTAAGWGVVVQRYQPKTAAQEKTILVGDGESKVHVVSENDKTALKEGMKAMRAITKDGDQVFFASYPEFYEVNNDEKGCKDLWRDAANIRVVQNPAEVTD